MMENNLRKPILISMLGLPGSGKSYFASKLSQKLPAVWLNSDKIRGSIFDNPTDVVPELRYGAVFETIDLFAKWVLEAGQNAIYDANNHKREHRDNHAKLAKEHGADAVVVYIQVFEEVSDKRAREREKSSHQIPLQQESLEKHKKMIELPTDDENVITIDGNIDFEEQFASFQKQLEEIHGM